MFSDYDGSEKTTPPTSDVSTASASSELQPTESSQPATEDAVATAKPVTIRKQSTKKMRKKMTNSQIHAELGKHSK